MGELPEISERGVLYPRRLPPRFQRIPATGPVSELVVWWWIAQWNEPPGSVSRQDLLPFPGCNLVVEQDMVGFAGPTTRASYRDLVGSGWAVAALLQPAAVPAFTSDPASVRDSYVSLSVPELHLQVAEAVAVGDFDDAVARLAAWVTARVGPVSDEARLANSLAEVAGSNSSVVTVSDLAAALNVSQRTVHRLAAQYIGLTPHALIRRRRLQEAAEHIRSEPGVSLSDVAAAHGFSDQAHFAREFQRFLGQTPREYQKRVENNGQIS
ncbi:AraC family transcriptional regulator [Kocuria sp. cx-116]|uniref:helix-turn-helix domain-containing protein n=1 Tax=Kocuria sp. cx-116 TaxID=2771378 RepID=UPI00168916E1|nr:helix-turn-helix domain-containing protein [Kocuria sp. cx-116]MBD2763108.1 AraC family transcriptional regulator [Kocuria sp. cx-116]